MLRNHYLLYFALLAYTPTLSAQTLCDRVGGMLMASAIADAMGGPWEGRSTEKSEQFLNQGNWISDFKDYNPWFQHHWNCYLRNAPAGMFTDDDRMRFSLANFMIDNSRNSSGAMTRRQLAGYIFRQYETGYDDFLAWDRKYARATTRQDSLQINVIRKQKFLAMWFGYEIAKTATSVYVPDSPPLKTPPYVRVNESSNNPGYPPEWHLETQADESITGDIKYQYNNNTYQQGQEMPLGLIYLLPAAAYYPGRAQKAFQYVLSVDFFDIKNAPYYPATAVAIIAELLGGRSWSSLSNDLLKSGLAALVQTDNSPVIADLNQGIRKAITIARKHRKLGPGNRTNARPFIFELHKELGNDPHLMYLVQEMLFVAVALMEFAQEDINFLIELGVNYGRDNDTVASIAATMGGAAHGLSALDKTHVDRVKAANSSYDFDAIIDSLCRVVAGR